MSCLLLSLRFLFIMALCMDGNVVVSRDVFPKVCPQLRQAGFLSFSPKETVIQDARVP